MNVNGIKGEIYKANKFLKPEEVEKMRENLFKNQLEICGVPAADEVHFMTPCEMYGHNYKLVFHDEKSINHTSYLVCGKCGKGIIVDEFKRVEE